MTLSTVDGLLRNPTQQINFQKLASGVALTAGFWHTMWDIDPLPSAGTIVMALTANGAVPTDADTGFPTIRNFNGGNVGYLSAAQFGISSPGNLTAGRVALKDRLFHAGSFVMTTLTTLSLTSQPDATGRMPDGAGVGNEIWIEVANGFSASASTIAANYTNSAGTAGRVTPASIALTSYGSRRCVQLALQAGDVGVQKIESVTIGGATNAAGTFNIIIARPLWVGCIPISTATDVHGFDKTGLPRVYDTSALWLMLMQAGTATSSGTDALVTIVDA